MGAKDLIWVCWQEPAVDCGKTSQIPYSWVTEVMIGDGRAPGSVLKCRWPKTRRQYTAKVIAPPSGHHERSQMKILRIPLALSLGSGDDDSTPSIAEIIAGSMRSTGQRNGAEGESSKSSMNSTTGLSHAMKDASQKRPESTGSFDSSSVHSPGAESMDDNEKDAESDADSPDHKPPNLVPETEPSNSRRYQHASAFNSSTTTATSSAFPKELQKWFVLQLTSLKNELLNNFDQVNHKISAMDLSIRSIRDRVNRMEGKIDLALLSLSPNGDIGSDDTQPWQRQEASEVATATKNLDDSDRSPPPLKRQCVAESEQGPSTSSSAQNGGRDNDVQILERNDSWKGTAASSSAVSAISVSVSPPAPKRNARKSIVHRAAPISPPPLLIKQAPSGLIINRRVHLPPVVTRMTPIAPASSSQTSSFSMGAKRRRRSASPMIVQYKPGSNNQVILLGGDPNYEIGRQLYAETLENVYEESPVYLILSLVRRLLCDQDVAKLWFKADQPTQPNTYAFRPDFAEALKRQGIMQYPHKPLTERDYVMKLNQATYDAKHRVKHGKGSTSRPQSYFPLSVIAVPVSPVLNESIEDSRSCSTSTKQQGKTNSESLGDKGGAVGASSCSEPGALDRPDDGADDPRQSDSGVSDDVLSVISVKKETEDESVSAEEQMREEAETAADNVSNAMAMLAELATVQD